MGAIKTGVYRHFKGNLYRVLSIAKNSETMEDMVVYQALYGERGVWVRPASMWNENVERDGKILRRFEYIGDETSSQSIIIEVLKEDFSVCKVANLSNITFKDDFFFIGKTDAENSVVCKTQNIPQNVTVREDGWKSMRIVGVLDFSLVGILSKISTILANAGIGIFAISTYNTDYILVKRENLKTAIIELAKNGYKIN